MAARISKLLCCVLCCVLFVLFLCTFLCFVLLWIVPCFCVLCIFLRTFFCVFVLCFVFLVTGNVVLFSLFCRKSYVKWYLLCYFGYFLYIFGFC